MRPPRKWDGGGGDNSSTEKQAKSNESEIDGDHAGRHVRVADGERADDEKERMHADHSRDGF